MFSIERESVKLPPCVVDSWGLGAWQLDSKTKRSFGFSGRGDLINEDAIAIIIVAITMRKIFT